MLSVILTFVSRQHVLKLNKHGNVNKSPTIHIHFLIAGVKNNYSFGKSERPWAHELTSQMGGELMSWSSSVSAALRIPMFHKLDRSLSIHSVLLTLVTLHCLAGARAPELYCFFATNYVALLLRCQWGQLHCRLGVSFYSHKMQNIQRIWNKKILPETTVLVLFNSMFF